MNIFHNRPLSLILCIIISGLYIFSLISSTAALLLSVFVIISSLICLFLKRFAKSRKICLILLIFLISGSLFRLYIGLTLDSRTDDNITHYMSGTVTELEGKGDDASFKLRLDSLNGDKSSLLISVRPRGESFVKAGDELVVIGDLSRLYYGEFTDENRYPLSQGISAICYPDEIRVTGSSGVGARHLMKEWRDTIVKRINKLSGDDAGGLCAGLLLGDTSYMSGSTVASFSRLGITHILALSGTHITLLSLALCKLCIFFGVPKRLERVLLILFITGFMALVGFPSSVMRAGLMVIISTVMVMISGYSDSITSLHLALFIILLVDPCAVLDVGLLLSFLATFAILAYANYIGREDKRGEGAIHKIKLLLTVSVFAICATQIVSALYFDKISAISALATLVFGLITQALIYLCLITLALGGILPIGILLQHLCALTDSFSKAICNLPHLEYSSRHPAVLIFSLIIFVAVMYFAIGKINRRRAYILSLCILFFLCIPVGVCSELHTLNEDKMVYQSGENDRILITGDAQASVLDLGEHNAREYFGVISLLREQRVASIDTYYLFGWGDGSDIYLNRLLSRVHINRVIVPDGAYGSKTMAKIDALCRLYGVRLDTLYKDDMLYIASFPTVFHALPDTDSLKVSFSMSIATNSGLFSYLTPDFVTESPYAELITNESDIIALGALGASHPKYYPEIITNDSKRLIISLPRRVATELVSGSVEIEYEGSFVIYD